MNKADKLSLIKDKKEAFPGSSPVLKEEWSLHTARVVVMGDDRVLGRLTRAYHSIRLAAVPNNATAKRCMFLSALVNE